MIRAYGMAKWALMIALGASLLAAGGCGGDRSPRLADYLDQLEFDVPLETAAYVPLGKFDIPIAASRKSSDSQSGTAGGGDGAAGDAVLMRLQFELTAETAPRYEKAVLEASERHRGALNDAILTVVRTSSVEELADPRLAAIEARLSEIVRPMLGEECVRQLLFYKLDAESMKRSESSSKAVAKNDGHGH
jgi:hypothetical protein